MDMQPSPHVSVIILNWNGATDTLECLKSLAQQNYSNFKVIIVDNASSDDSLTLLRDYAAPYPLILIENSTNDGFAEGNNVGIRYALNAGTDYIFLLNNDTVVDPALINELIESASSHPDAGILSCKIFYHADPDRLWYAGARWISNEMHFVHIGDGQLDDGRSFEETVETDYASGCALFVSVSVLAHIGMLDPRFFLTYEETDLCYRARAAGYSVLYEPRARLWHKVSASFGGTESPLQRYFYQRNLLLWGEQHLSRHEYWSLFKKIFRDTVRIEFGESTQVSSLRRLVWAVLSVRRRLRRDGTDKFARVRWLGFRDYILRRFGDCPNEVRLLNRRSCS